MKRQPLKGLRIDGRVLEKLMETNYQAVKPTLDLENSEGIDL